MFKVILSAKAKKQLKQFSKIYQQEALSDIFLDIKENPFAGKPLSLDLTGQLAYKAGKYRIVYKVELADKTINILRIGHRSTIYN